MGNKKTTIFNKNHITITKCKESIPSLLTYERTNLSTKKNQQGNFKCSYSTLKLGRYATFYEKTEYCTFTSERSRQRINKNIKEKEIRLKSPLGFYYTKVIKPEMEPIRSKSITTCKTYRFYTEEGTNYELIYYTSANGASISFDKRPWELLDNEYFEDNYVEALIDIINKITVDASSKYTHKDFGNHYLSRKEGGYYNSDYKYEYIIGSMTEIKKKIFTDLFGYPDGPKRQTNNEKILSHGFDLKTSFRKM